MKLKKNIAVSESGFVFDPTTGDSYSLNPVGVSVIELLQENKSLDEIICSLENEYEAERMVIERNVQDFIGMLEQYNLLTHEEK